VEERSERLKIFYLPGYSPKLNPDELVNQAVESNAVGRNGVRDVKQLVAKSAPSSRARIVAATWSDATSWART
jgi:hypothetical protein